ncbi:MAG: type IV secretion system DNA-binding domain-containing protein [Desulfobacteraceae bacterium]|nr:type IV secretion system DNA-binding domain-containing protein [Desulfobacteraceae bacterium]
MPSETVSKALNPPSARFTGFEMQKKARAYESFEILTSALKMDAKMHAYIIGVLVLVHAVLFACLVGGTWSEKRMNALSYCVSKLAVVVNRSDARLNVFRSDGSYYKQGAGQIINTEKFAINARNQGILMLFFVLVSSPVYLLHRLAVKKLRTTSETREKKQYIRGSKLISADEFRGKTRKDGTVTGFNLGEIAMPIENETRGTAILGGPGTGKTNCIRPMIKKIKERGGHGIIYDYKGDYVSEFYDPETDFIFNIVDERCLGWRVFNDISSKTDIEAISYSLCPDPAQGKPFWEDGTRSIFAAGLLHCYKDKKLTNQHLWDFVSMPTGEMKEAIKGVKGAEPALKALGAGDGDSRQADGFQAVLMQYMKCFEYLAKIDGGFSVNDWVENGQGLIFVTNYEAIAQTLRPIMSLFIDMAICRLLSMPDNGQRRFYVVLDEFGTLNKLNIPRLSTTGRSKGSCMILGTQDRKQPIRVYGRELVDSMDAALKNRIIFSLEGDAADYESRMRIKETEYIVWERGMSMGPDDHRDGVTLNPKKYREPLFLPADIARLQDLHGIVKLQNYDFVLSKWQYDQPKPQHEQLMLRDDLSLDYLLAEEKQLKNDSDEIEPYFSPNSLEL